MKSSSTVGLSILASGLSFVGAASATDIVIDGSYESATNNYVTEIIGNGGNDAAGIDGGWTHFSTYNYSAGYTQTGPVGSGRVYLRPYNDMGGSTTVRQTNTLTRAITAENIDAGVGQYVISAWFSTYIGQNDYSVLTLQFLDGSLANLGSPVTIGGAAFVAALPGGNGLRAWGRDARTNSIPQGARYASITTVATALVNLPDGYVDLVQLDITTSTAISASATPANNTTGVSPTAIVSVMFQDGSPTPILDTNSVRLTFDGALVSPVIQKSGALTTVQYDPPGLLAPLSRHTYRIAFNNVGGATPNRTNEFSFTVADYYNFLLTPPLYLETFDGTSEGSLPAGWSSYGFGGQTDPDCNPLAPDIGGLQDLHSACYTNWVVVNSERFRSNMLTYADHGPSLDYQRVLNTNRVNVVNSNRVPSVAQGNIVFGNSGYQDDTASQIVYLFSPDFDLTGRTNVYLGYHSLWEQNQDSIGAVEYSIDEGATWLPVVYMLEEPDIVRDAEGRIDGAATFAAMHDDVATYVDPVDMQMKGGNYGAFIGVDSNRWAQLGPFISARVNDDPGESKRVEVFPLSAASNRSKVRLRFAHAGADSWYFGIDNVGFYSLNAVTPPRLMGPTPTNLTEAVGNTAIFGVTVSGLGPFTYQWRHQGTNVPGQTNDVLGLPNLQLANAGTYTVVVTYVGGSVTSSPAALVVFTPEPARVIGQWDFDNFDLMATCGRDLEYFDRYVDDNTFFGDTDFIGAGPIDGEVANVMLFPGATLTQPMGGYKMFHGLSGTGGGSNVNQYTLIMDVFYPPSSTGVRRTLLQTDPSNTSDGDIRIDESNRIGVGGNFHGSILSNTWYRIALVVDLVGPGPHPILAKFVNGVKVGQHALAEGRDGRWSLSANTNAPWALLLGDNDVDAYTGYASSIQLRVGRLSDVAIAAMGAPKASKIPGAACAVTSGGNIFIRWSGSVLESANEVTGSWTTVSGAGKPYQVPMPLTGRTFYRAR